MIFLSTDDPEEAVDFGTIGENSRSSSRPRSHAFSLRAPEDDGEQDTLSIILEDANVQPLSPSLPYRLASLSTARQAAT